MFNKFRYIIISLLLVISFFTGRCIHTLASNNHNKHQKNYSSPTIVIDPGHGGSDPGKISASGIFEKDINLEISLVLSQLFSNRGYNVVLTRNDDYDLSDFNSSNPKMDDLSKRAHIMSEDDVILTVSIHQNSFTDTNSCGPQVFYYSKSDEGKRLATSVMSILNTSLDIKAPRNIKANSDYYILKNSSSPAIIVECGFLSNSIEAEFLTDKLYQQKLARAIYFGVIDYLDQAVP